MDTPHVILGILVAVAIGVWAMNIWGGWAEREYEKRKDYALSWYWLRLMGITISRENCVRYIKVVCALGIMLVSIGLAAGFLFGIVR